MPVPEKIIDTAWANLAELMAEGEPEDRRIAIGMALSYAMPTVLFEEEPDEGTTAEPDDEGTGGGTGGESVG